MRRYLSNSKKWRDGNRASVSCMVMQWWRNLICHCHTVGSITQSSTASPFCVHNNANLIRERYNQGHSCRVRWTKSLCKVVTTSAWTNHDEDMKIAVKIHRYSAIVTTVIDTPPPYQQTNPLSRYHNIYCCAHCTPLPPWPCPWCSSSSIGVEVAFFWPCASTSSRTISSSSISSSISVGTVGRGGRIDSRSYE